MSVIKHQFKLTHARWHKVRLPEQKYHHIIVITVTKLSRKTNLADANPVELSITVTKCVRNNDGNNTECYVVQYTH